MMSFDDELDRVVERVLSDAEDSLPLDSEHSVHSPELEELVWVAARLRATAPTDSAIIQHRVWESVSARMGEPVPLRQKFWGRVRAGLPALSRAAAVLVVLLVSSGAAVGMAAANSMPDDVFYPLKLTWEQSQIGLTSDPSARAALELSFANRRLAELVAREEAGKGVSSVALDAMMSATVRASEVLHSIDDREKKESVGADLASLTSHQEKVLSSLLERAPEPAREGLRRALQVAQNLKDKSSEQPEKEPTKGSGDTPDQEEQTSPPAQEKQTSPPGQDKKTSPPGQEKEISPPGQDKKTSSPGQNKKSGGDQGKRSSKENASTTLG